MVSMNQESKNLILIVEDSPTQLAQLDYLLKKAGYQTVLARNGEEGLKQLETVTPDLVISDILMPVMDGYGLCRKMKDNPRLRDIPVIILTALSDPQDVIAGLQSGADNFITKPYNEKFLLSRVRHVILNKELRKSQRSDVGIEIFFKGQRHKITSDRLQIIDLLFSTFENAIQKNSELAEANKTLASTKDELRRLNEALEEKIRERTKTIAHLNNVLRSIRDINQLIVKQQDPGFMIHEACRILSRTTGYLIVWIMLIDEGGRFRNLVQSGLDPSTETLLRSHLMEKDRPNPLKEALERPGTHLCEPPFTSFLPDMGLPENREGLRAIIRLECGSRVFGLLSVHMAKGMPIGKEESELIEEVAGDIAFALRNMELEREKILTEKRLKESEERYRLHFENVSDIIFSIDPGYRIITLSPSMETILGYSPGPLLGETLDNLPFLEKLGVMAIRETSEHLFSGGSPESFVNTLVSQDGIKRFFEIKGSPLVRKGRVEAAIFVARDITERKLAEEWLLRERTMLDRIMKTSPAGIVIVHQNGKVTYANRRAEEIFGLKQEEVLDRTYDDPAWKNTDYEGQPIPEEDLPFSRVMRERQAVYGVRHAIEWPDGRRVFLDIHGAPLFDEKGLVTDVIFIINDISGQIHMEYLYRTLAEKSFSGVYVIQDGVFHYVNENAARFAGYRPDELSGQRSLRIVHPEDRPSVIEYTQKRLSGTEHGPHEFRILTKQGETRWILEALAPITFDGRPALLGSSMEITERKSIEEEQKKLKERLLQSQKMEAIGTLAGGIAHDFNNILSAIMGYAELALDRSGGENDLDLDLKEIITASRRARDLVRQILTFSRQTEQEKLPLQVKLILKEGLKFLRASLPSTIEIRQDIESNSFILANPTQIHQILMNLSTNAAHAMEEKGGLISVTLKDVLLDESFISLHPGIQPGKHVCLTVQDTGKGIPPEILPRIFEPFFTTKKRGEGTGMGLSLVHGIVNDHGGTINVYSVPEEGSIFQVYFPVIEEEEKTEGAQTTTAFTGKGCILLVDDEPALLEMTGKMLDRLGFQVMLQNNGIGALNLFRENPDAFDLVITDITMPGMTGDVLAREILKTRPGIPIILCTGFSTRINEEQARSMGVSALITKPVLKDELIATIQSVRKERK